MVWFTVILFQQESKFVKLVYFGWGNYQIFEVYEERF